MKTGSDHVLVVFSYNECDRYGILRKSIRYGKGKRRIKQDEF